MPAHPPARRLLTDLLIIAGIGLVMGFIGPFGTFAMPLAARIGTWILFGLVGFALFRPMAPLARWLGARLPWPAVLLVAGLLLFVPSVPMTGAVLFILDDYRPGDGISIPALLQLFGQVWLLGALVFGVFMLIYRDEGRARDHATAEPDRAMGIAAEPAIAPGETAPALAERLPPGFGPILALKAEDHYVRVFGSAGSTLLLMRLGDAIGETEGIEGLRVHRSWWVAHAAIDRVDARGRGGVLHLVNGETAQVSRDNLAQVRQALQRAR